MTADSPPRVGEVAVYEAGGLFRAHRVVAISPTEILVRPDRPGAALERVPQHALRGVWVDGAGPRNAFLQPRAGRIVLRLSTAVSGPTPVGALKALAGRMNLLPASGMRVTVFHGDPADLVSALSQVGLNTRVASLEALAAAYLGDGEPGSRDGFVAVARLLRYVIGAVAVSRAQGGGRAQVGLAMRRGHRQPAVAVALLELAIDEARHRGFTALEAEGREGTPVRAALQATGFELVETEHRRVPATGARIGLFRRAVDTGGSA